MLKQWFFFSFFCSWFCQIWKGNAMQFIRNRFWNPCRFLWEHTRIDLPFDYICIQAMRNVQYTVVSQQIRLLIERLPPGSQQGLMDRGQSPIKLSESNFLFSLASSCSPHTFLTHTNHSSIRSWSSIKELSHILHLLLVNDSWWNAYFMLYCMQFYVCKKYVKVCQIASTSGLYH